MYYWKETLRYSNFRVSTWELPLIGVCDAAQGWQFCHQYIGHFWINIHVKWKNGKKNILMLKKIKQKLADESNYANKIIRFFHLHVWSETLSVSGNLLPSRDEEENYATERFVPTVNLWLGPSLGRSDNEKNVYVCFGSGGRDVQTLLGLIIGVMLAVRGLSPSPLRGVEAPVAPVAFKKWLLSFWKKPACFSFVISHFHPPPPVERTITVILMKVVTTQMEKKSDDRLRLKWEYLLE